MKKALIILTGFVLLGILSGCSTVMPMGVFHTNATLPAQVVSKEEIPKDCKVGTSQASSYFSVVCIGDASIKKAIENANLKKIYYVDWQVTNPWFIGLKTVYTTRVYGE